MKRASSWEQWLGSLLLWWMVVWCPAVAVAQRNTAILIDASGSMEGFFKTGSIYALSNNVARSIIDDVDKSIIDQLKDAYYFIYHRNEEWHKGLIPYSTGGRPNTNNTVTLIDRAYEEVRRLSRKFGALWLITDNIQDTAGLQQEREDIKLFYNKLKRDDVQLVYFFPVKRDFDGSLYAEDGQTPITRPDRPYRNQRGVVVYAILFDKQQEDAFRSAVQRAERHLGAPSIQAIPLLQKPRGTANETGLAIEQKWDPEENAKIAQPYRFERSAGPSGETMLYSADVQSSNAVAGTFVVRFTSRVPHVRINDAKVKTAVVTPFALAGVANTDPTLQPEPEAISTLRPDRQSGNIEVRIRFPEGLPLYEPNACAWGCSNRPGEYVGKIKVALEVHQERVELDDDERERYSTADKAFFTSTDPKYHQRIYGLNYLVGGLTNEFKPDNGRNVTETSQEFYTVVFQLQCPIPSSFWNYLLAGLAGVGAVGGMVWLLRRSPDYRLTLEEGGTYRLWVQRTHGNHSYDDTREYDGEPQGHEDEEVVHLPLLSFGRGHPISWPDQIVADLKRSPLGTVYVRAMPGFAIDGHLRHRTLTPSAAGTAFAVTERKGNPPDDASPPPPRGRKRRSRSSYDIDDEYDA